VLVDLDLALKVSHLQFKSHNAGQHLVGELFAQAAPLLGVRRLVVADQLFEQASFA
jgi:hypothetical protein